jgi:antitoxin component YwqK of YwqJK toxin-antitoxin module
MIHEKIKHMFVHHAHRYLTLFLVITSLVVSSCTKTEKTYWENGKLKSVFTKKGMRFHGISTWYYSDGKKQHECTYVNDTLQGTSTRWYNNSRISSVDIYKDNLRHGTSLGYDYDGKLISEVNYKNDTLDGPFKEFYSTGQTKVEGNYLKGMFDGKWMYYNQDGTIVGMGEYKSGSGKQRAWYPDGKLKRIIQYQDNEKHGTEIWYDPEGKIEKTLTYDHGQLVSNTDQSQ